MKDYSKSPAPNFDAVEDVRATLGEALWKETRSAIARNAEMYKRPKRWIEVCTACRIRHTFQRAAWYDLHFGQGAWSKANAIDAVSGMESKT